MLTRSSASAEIADLLNALGPDAPEVVVKRTTKTKNATYGTVDAWADAHTYDHGILWSETQRGQEQVQGGKMVPMKQLKLAVLKDSFVPTTTDRLLHEGTLYSITGSNIGVVDDFCLIFDVVLTPEDT
jgi:hypothetical protein